MAINAQLGLRQSPVNALVGGFMQGREMKQQEQRQNALLEMQQQKMQAEQQQQAQSRQQMQMQQLGRLLNHAQDEGTYQQAKAAAAQIGIDVSAAPANYDPNWVGQQKLILSAYEKDGGAGLTSTMKELVALGYQPGSPEFRQALAQTMNAGYSKPYTDQSGATRLYTPQIAVPAQQPASQPMTAAPLEFDTYLGAVNTQGPEYAANLLRTAGRPVRVASPDQARQLPSGTPIILPDGSEGRVP